MYTQCPGCGTVFRVTAAVLRAAHGQVRCGVCDATFDALRDLTDEIEGDAGGAVSPDPVGAAAPPPPADAPAANPFELAQASRHSASTDEQRAPDLRVRAPTEPPAPHAPVPPDELAAAVNVLEPEDFEHIVLSGEAEHDGDLPEAAYEFDLPADEWERVFIAPSEPPAPLDLDLAAQPTAIFTESERPDEFLILEEEPAAGSDPLARTDEFEIPADWAVVDDKDRPGPPDEFAIEPDVAHVLRVAPQDLPAPDAAAPPTAPDGPELLAPAVGARRGLVGPARIAAAVLLALGLAAQVVHHWREPLAGVALVGPALARFYAHIGAPLEPSWDVLAYEVRQWGAASEEAAGALRMRASVVNHAARPQPYPLLRVTLEDRFGSMVARREFAPAEYLPGRAPPATLLAPGARADADLSLADPGSQAVGFELDVCLRRAEVLTCAADAKPAGGG